MIIQRTEHQRTKEDMQTHIDSLLAQFYACQERKALLEIKINQLKVSITANPTGQMSILGSRNPFDQMQLGERKNLLERTKKASATASTVGGDLFDQIFRARRNFYREYPEDNPTLAIAFT